MGEKIVGLDLHFLVFAANHSCLPDLLPLMLAHSPFFARKVTTKNDLALVGLSGKSELFLNYDWLMQNIDWINLPGDNMQSGGFPPKSSTRRPHRQMNRQQFSRIINSNLSRRILLDSSHRSFKCKRRFQERYCVETALPFS